MKTRKNSISPRCLWGINLLGLAVLLMFSGVTSANSPAGCFANNVALAMAKSHNEAVAGETVSYVVAVGNAEDSPLPDGCDAENVIVKFACPGADGQPDWANEVILEVAPGRSLPVDGSGNHLYLPADFPGLNCVMTGGVSPVWAGSKAIGDLLDGDTPSDLSRENEVQVKINTCEVKVNKEVSCNLGIDWIDYNVFVYGNEDGTESCNALDNADIWVRYQAQNSGEADLFACNLTESNPAIGPGTHVGNIASGDTTGYYDAPAAECTDAVTGGEPDTAEITCDCTDTPADGITTTAWDEASFGCLTPPDVTIAKQCDRTPEGHNDITVTVQRVGGDLDLNCEVQDNIFYDDDTCPADVGTGSPLALSNNSYTLTADGQTEVSLGTTPPLATQACNTAEVDCSYSHGGVNYPVDDLSAIECLPADCAVQINKEVSCNGGPWEDANGFVSANEDGTDGCSTLDGNTVDYRYSVQNSGDVPLYSCVLSDTNGEIVFGPNVGDIPIDNIPFWINSDTAECSDSLEAGEPNEATVSCFCSSGLDDGYKTSASDSADVTCQSQSELSILKECIDLDGDGASDQTKVTVTATGDTDLGFTNCRISDDIYLEDNDCPADTGPGTDVPLDNAGPHDLAPGESVIATGPLPDLENDACNVGRVVCTSVGTGLDVDIDDDDPCYKPGDGCLTRTPGFWGTHPHVTALFLPLNHNGLDITNVDAYTDGSAIEDMCSVGTDAKNAVDPATTNTNTNLARHCMAAVLNIAASESLGGSCSSVHAGLNEQIGECCTDPGMTGESKSDIDAAACIGFLEAFNESPDTLATQGPFVSPGPADSEACRDSKNNGFLNSHPWGAAPAKGGKKPK